VNTEVPTFTCPRCQRGEFRSLPGPSGKAFCPWCGIAVEPRPSPAQSADQAAPPPVLLSLEELAEQISGHTKRRPAPVPESPARPLPPPPVPRPDLEARLAESERRREAAEAELRKELEKKQEIKKAVLAEMGRLESQIADANARVRRKDEEHASALESIDLLQNAQKQEWDGQEMKLRELIARAETARLDLEAELEKTRKAAAAVQADLDSVRADASIQRSDYGAAAAERTDLRKKLAAADAKLRANKDAAVRLKDLERQLLEAQARGAGLQSDLEKRDQRIKDLGLLVKTLGDRLNQLADRHR
jgi:DNA repair exonuclease SbcCD ATPase subunit